MKVTRLGYPQPILNSGTGLNAGGRVPPGGNDLTVLTSNGSNGRYWGENVRRITANGSNTLQGPDVNFASGSNITFSISSNTLTIHGQAGGSGSLTVKDEGSTLSTAADTLDFVGAGVTASGTGGTKTITIPGGSGGAAVLPLDVAPGSPHAKDDEFPGSSLDAKWTNPITSTRTNTLAVANGWVTLEPSDAGSSSTASRGAWGIRQVSPTGSFTVMAKIADGRAGDDARVGIFVAIATGKAYVLGSQRQNSRIANLNGVTTYSESADWSAYDGALDTFTSPAWPGPIWFRLVYDSGASTLTAYYSASGVSWTLLGSASSVSQPNRMGLCIWANTADVLANHELAADWFRVTEP